MHLLADWRSCTACWTPDSKWITQDIFKQGQADQFLTLTGWLLLLQARMVHPVIAADGYTYEYDAVKSWLQAALRSPVTGCTLAHSHLVPNLIMKGFLVDAAAK